MGCPLVKVTNTLEQQWLYSLAIWPDRPRDLHKEVGQVGGCLLRNSSAQGTSSSVCCAAWESAREKWVEVVCAGAAGQVGFG